MTPIEAVIDTNVFYSALRSRRGCSFKLVDDFMSGKASWKWNISNACVLEYEEVLLRKSIPTPVVDVFLADLLSKGSRIRIVESFRPLAIDADDDLFAELALAANADFLVTFNVRDFLPVKRLGIRVVTPQEFDTIMQTRRA